MIRYQLRCHIGARRRFNQDNFLLDGVYLNPQKANSGAVLSGAFKKLPQLVGVFDGLGGEECGEIASYIAASEFAKVRNFRSPGEDLMRLCRQINRSICEYANENGVLSMGTTAALLYISKRSFTACNVGDSRIYRYSHGKLIRLSEDHVTAAPLGGKPPLLQNLGVPESVLLIKPSVVTVKPEIGDVFLLCSDGLTDMVPDEKTEEIISSLPLQEAADALLSEALANGGRDNISIMLVSCVKSSIIERAAESIRRAKWTIF